MRAMDWVRVALALMSFGCSADRASDTDTDVDPETIVSFASGESYVGNASILNVRMREDGSAREATFDLGSGDRHTNTSVWNVFAPLDIADVLEDGSSVVDLSAAPGLISRSGPTGGTSSAGGHLSLHFASGVVEGNVVATPNDLNASFRSQFAIACTIDGKFFDETGTDVDDALESEQCAPLAALR